MNDTHSKTNADFKTIKTGHPALGQKLLTYFISVMPERLAFSSRMIACCGDSNHVHGAAHVPVSTSASPRLSPSS